MPKRVRSREYMDRLNEYRRNKRATERSLKTGQSIVDHERNNKTAAMPVLSEDETKLTSGKISELIDDIRRVQQENPEKFITRNFYKNNGSYTESAWTSLFGTFEEFKRYAALNVSRGVHRIELNTAHHAAKDRYRGFQEIELDPCVGKYDRPDNTPGYKRIVVASDFHGQNSDPFVLKVLIETISRIKPDVVCLAGDVYDLYDFSRFDKDPRQSNLKAEFDFVKNKILSPIRNAAGPKCLIDFILGNHDARLLRHLADKTPYMKVLLELMGHTMSSLMGLDEFQINLVSRMDLAAHKPMELRHEMAKNYKTYYSLLTIDHGDTKNNGFKLCRVYGHTHKPSLSTNVHEVYGDIWSMCLGSIAKIDLEYVDGLNRYHNGFGIVHIDTERNTCVAEPVIFSNNMAIVGGKIYTRS